jgi:hypothetical protein
VLTGKLPSAEEGLQLNFCKTLACDNFGLSEAQYYLLQRDNPLHPAMICKQCGAFPPLLNNRAVLHEQQRLKSLHNSKLACCNHRDCSNFGLDVLTHREHYHAFGYSGDRQRYRCRSCQSTFVDRWSGGNRYLVIQQKLLALLFTGYNVREICRKLTINPKTFYDQLNTIASRCRRQLYLFDSRLYHHHNKSAIGIASAVVPLQPQSDNGVLWFVSGEVHSGYILAQDINYSPDGHAPSAQTHDPYSSEPQYVSDDFVGFNHNLSENTGSLKSRIELNYQRILSRGNVEDPLCHLGKLHYPSKGAVVRPPYTSSAHYLTLAQNLSAFKHIDLFMPQEPLLRSAAMSVFLNRIQDKSIDLVYVMEDTQWISSPKIDVSVIGWWRDRWAINQTNNAGKGICHQTDHSPNDDYWLNRASTVSIEQFQHNFYQHFTCLINEPRRRLRPGGLAPLLDIYRAWHNLCRQDSAGNTPAQSIGITNGPLTLAQLLS